MVDSTSPSSRHRLRPSLAFVVPVGLWILAVAQPVLEVILEHPPFLTAHRVTGAKLLYLAVAACLVPLPLSLGAALASTRSAELGSRFLGAVAGLALGAITLQLVELETASEALLVGALGTAAGALIYLRWAVVRKYTHIVAVGALLLPVRFVTQGLEAVPSLSSPLHAAPAGSVRSPRPIVIVLFDELPLVSLLATESSLDEGRFPHLAELAGRSAWFPNATTVAATTAQATPAILSGRWPEDGRTNTFDSWPVNLFTLLAADFELNVLESSTRLCPEALCDPERFVPRPTPAELLADAGAIALHRLAPRELDRRLPTIDADWIGFWREPAGRTARTETHGDLQLERFEQFLDRLAISGRASLHFVHMYVPHLPWKRIPSGRQYATAGTYPHGLDRQRWVGSRWEIDQAWQRHLLQVGVVDHLVGRLLDRLDSWTHGREALVAVLSDHGTSFEPGRTRRNARRANLAEVANVPLFIRLPGQLEDATDKRQATTLDLLPTVLAAVEFEGAVELSGRSLLAAPPDEDRTTLFTGHPSGALRGVAIEFSTGDLDRGPLVSAIRERFGTGDWAPVFDLSARPDLVDRSLGRFDVAPSERRIELANGANRVYDPSAGRLPIHVIGRLLDRPPERQPVDLALTLGGRIVTVTTTYRDADGHSFTAMLDPADLVPGDNPLSIYVVVETAGPTRLEATTISTPDR